jgi:signal transduction histidine kinase
LDPDVFDTVSSLKLKFENKDLIHRLEHRVQERTFDHKRAEEELKTERAKFEIMLRQLPVGVIIAEAESGKIIYSNAQVARIWKQKFPTSNSIEDYVQYKGFHPDGRPYLPHEWPLSRSLTEGEIVKEEEINFQRGDDSFGWMSVNSTPIRDDDGHVIAGIVTFSDISERKKSEEILNRYRAELELEVSNRTAEIQGQYRELEKLNATIRQLSRKTIEAMENDRKALSKEIHDSIAGTLSAIKMLLEAHIENAAQNSASHTHILPLEEITTHLADAIKETREISFQLRSRTLDDFGLKAAIFEHFQQFRKFYPEIRIVPEIEIADERIADDIQTVLYRVVQEALNNVGKHSSATQVHVKLINNQNQLWMKISDNGCGFDIDQLMSSNQSIMYYGIHSMRERVELCKGKIEIHSEHGKGTNIDISIPI